MTTLQKDDDDDDRGITYKEDDSVDRGMRRGKTVVWVQ